MRGAIGKNNALKIHDQDTLTQSALLLKIIRLMKINPVARKLQKLGTEAGFMPTWLGQLTTVRFMCVDAEALSPPRLKLLKLDMMILLQICEPSAVCCNLCSWTHIEATAHTPTFAGVHLQVALMIL